MATLWDHATIDWFTDARTWQHTTWRGVPALQNPLDLWLLQEELARRRYERVIETGTAFGGSALFLCDMLDVLGYPPKVAVYTIDVELRSLPSHPRLWPLVGDSVVLGESFEGGPSTLIKLDSDHSTAHVRRELAIYSRLSTSGDLLLVEDTAMGHPCPHPEGPTATGPYEAVEAFLATGAPFQRASEMERFKLTAHPGGWLRRL